MKPNENAQNLTYAILEQLSKQYDAVILECAKVVLVNAGVKPLVSGEPVAIESNLVTATTSKAIIDCAREMARYLNDSDSEMAILACLLTDGPDQPAADGDICPICGGELDFDGDEEIAYEVGRFTEAHWRCMDCGARGTQMNDIVFSRHEDVYNSSGEPIDPAAFCY